MDFAKDNAFVFDEVYLERALLSRLTDSQATLTDNDNEVDPDTAESSPDVPNAYEKMVELLKETLPSPKPDMIKIRLWRPAKAKLTTLSPHESFKIGRAHV